MHKANIDYIRAAEKKLGIYLPIIVDLQGPKIRVSDLKDSVIQLETGKNIYIADSNQLKKLKTSKPDNIIPVEYPSIAKDVKVGDILLFDDGLMQVIVKKVDNPLILVTVMNGGTLKSRKGINLPNIDISQPSMSDKDKDDVKFAIAHNVEYIALSFVRKAEDIIHIKKYIKKSGGSQWVIAKARSSC